MIDIADIIPVATRSLELLLVLVFQQKHHDRPLVDLVCSDNEKQGRSRQAIAKVEAQQDSESSRKVA